VRIQAGCAQVPLQLGGRALVDERFLAAAHARGLQVHVWTVDTPEESAAMLDLGVDGLMTDRPAMLRELLEKRGQWVPR
jgi:glycerophosphoryl diester phosphodiesterase